MVVDVWCILFLQLESLLCVRSWAMYGNGNQSRYRGLCFKWNHAMRWEKSKMQMHSTYVLTLCLWLNEQHWKFAQCINKSRVVPFLHVWKIFALFVGVRILVCECVAHMWCYTIRSTGITFASNYKYNTKPMIWCVSLCLSLDFLLNCIENTAYTAGDGNMLT